MFHSLNDILKYYYNAHSIFFAHRSCKLSVHTEWTVLRHLNMSQGHILYNLVHPRANKNL